jgi:hypothetical protein
MVVDVEITKWYHNKDVAFAIGVDELPIGGSFNDGPSDEKWDTFYWSRAKNDFWTLYWKPILDNNPWVYYSLGWVPSHTSPFDLQDYPQPVDVNKKELIWKSSTGKKWIEEVMKPIFAYGKGHYDQWVGHGYWHEECINHYYPYWYPQSTIFQKGKPYDDPTFMIKTLEDFQRAFKFAWGHQCTVWNTTPFGGARPDMPVLLSRSGIYGLGLWLNVDGQPLNLNSGLRATKTAKKIFYSPIGSMVTHEGSLPGKSYKVKIGEMSYWYQDESILNVQLMNPELEKINKTIIKSPFSIKAKDRIVVAPYSLSLEGSFSNFKKRTNKMMSEFRNFDAPFLYYFMHAQMNWIDGLGGGSIIHVLKDNREKFIGLSFIFLLFIMLFFSNLFFVLFIVFSIVSLSLVIMKMLKIIDDKHVKSLAFIWGYGKNAKKHDKELQWLQNKYGDRLWATTFSKACQYYDIRKKTKFDIKVKKDQIKIIMDSSECLDWGKRSLPVSLRLKGVKNIDRYYYSFCSKKINSIDFQRLPNGDIILKDIEIKPKAITECTVIVNSR